MRTLKWVWAILTLLCLTGAQTSQVNTYVNGNVLTADQLNSEFGNLYSTVNNLDEANLSSITSIPPAKISATIDGLGIVRQASGQLDAQTDGSTLEISSDQLRIKDSGVTTAKINNAAVTSSKIASDINIVITDGSAATPAVRFNSDTDTGLYRAGANSIGFSTNGGEKALINADGIRVNPDGTAGAPAYSWSGDGDTGMYRSANDNLSLATGGTERVKVTETEVQINSANLNVAQSLQIAGGGLFKAKRFTGTLAASATLDLTITGTVLGAVGAGQLNAGVSALYGVMEVGNNSLRFVSGELFVNPDRVRITNLAASPAIYNVLVFYY